MWGVLVKVTLAEDERAALDRVRGEVPLSAFLRGAGLAEARRLEAMVGGAARQVDGLSAPVRVGGPVGVGGGSLPAGAVGGAVGSRQRGRQSEVVRGSRPKSTRPPKQAGAPAQRRQAVPGPDVENIVSSAQAKRRARPAVPKRAKS